MEPGAAPPPKPGWGGSRALAGRAARRLARVRADAAAFTPRLTLVLAPREMRWTAQHRAAVAHNRARTLELLADLHALAGEAQRRRLQGEIDALASCPQAWPAPNRLASAAGGR